MSDKAKKIVLINSSCGVGSTGKICVSIAKEYEKKDWESKVAYGRVDYVPEEYKRFAVRIGSRGEMLAHVVSTRVIDNHGFASKRATKRFLKWLDEYNPDVLWLHNIHGYYINIEMLFDWIKRHDNLEVKWTLHDCWAFTGHCAHFSALKCESWKTGCHNCIQKHNYPSSYFIDRSRRNYIDKRKIFCGVENMTLVTPSEWLAGLVRQSFLKDYPISVIYNEIDRDVFQPTESDIRNKLGIGDKILVLGVAYIWDTRKGLGDFIKLSKMLDDTYVILLVGLKKKQMKGLPHNIKAIERTGDQKELAGIYAAADYFVNPSLEETFGLTTVEALACGTKAVVYSDTACEEIAKRYEGVVVPNGDVEAIYHYITSDKGRSNETRK